MLINPFAANVGGSAVLAKPPARPNPDCAGPKAAEYDTRPVIDEPKAITPDNAGRDAPKDAVDEPLMDFGLRLVEQMPPKKPNQGQIKAETEAQNLAPGAASVENQTGKTALAENQAALVENQAAEAENETAKGRAQVISEKSAAAATVLLGKTVAGETGAAETGAAEAVVAEADNGLSQEAGAKTVENGVSLLNTSNISRLPDLTVQAGKETGAKPSAETCGKPSAESSGKPSAESGTKASAVAGAASESGAKNASGTVQQGEIEAGTTEFGLSKGLPVGDSRTGEGPQEAQILPSGKPSVVQEGAFAGGDIKDLGVAPLDKAGPIAIGGQESSEPGEQTVSNTSPAPDGNVVAAKRASSDSQPGSDGDGKGEPAAAFGKPEGVGPREPAAAFGKPDGVGPREPAAAFGKPDGVGPREPAAAFGKPDGVGPREPAAAFGKPDGVGPGEPEVGLGEAENKGDGDRGGQVFSESPQGNGREGGLGEKAFPGDSFFQKLNPTQVAVTAGPAKANSSTGSDSSSGSGVERAFSPADPQVPIGEQVSTAAQGAKAGGNVSGGDGSATVSEQIRESISSSIVAGDQQVTIRLNPPELGKVVVRFQEQDDQITGLLEVSKAETRVEIQQALPDILRNLQGMGVHVRRLDVVLTGEHERQGTGGESAGNQQENWGAGQGSENPNPHTTYAGLNEFLANSGPYSQALGGAEGIVTDESIDMFA